MAFGRQQQRGDRTLTLAAVGATAARAVLDATGAGDDTAAGWTIHNLGPNSVYVGGDDVVAPGVAGDKIGQLVASGGTLDLWALPSKTWVICAAAQTALITINGA